MQRRVFLQSMLAGSSLFPAILADLSPTAFRLGLPAETNHPRRRAIHISRRVAKTHHLHLFPTVAYHRMDTFDFKPKLFAADGKVTGVGGGLSNEKRVLLKPFWKFRPGGNRELWSAICSRICEIVLTIFVSSAR